MQPTLRLLETAHRLLLQRRHLGQAPAELAFYGGTFTALHEDDLSRCLAFAHSMRDAGLIDGFRCSTRPDAIDAAILGRLADSGCSLVEIGVQSFDDRSLALSGRNYSGDDAKTACAMVKCAGLALGVQLLPGMPGCTPAVFLRDVMVALEAGCDVMRHYPCLVLDGTQLAESWRRGDFRPWEMGPCLDTLADGLLAAMAAGIPVIRIGLPPEPSMLRLLLAGPHHPALGSRVHARALLKACARHACGREIKTLQVPSHCQGFIWGHGKELREAWNNLGVCRERLVFSAEHAVRMKVRNAAPL